MNEKNRRLALISQEISVLTLPVGLIEQIIRLCVRHHCRCTDSFPPVEHAVYKDVEIGLVFQSESTLRRHSVKIQSETSCVYLSALEYTCSSDLVVETEETDSNGYVLRLISSDIWMTQPDKLLADYVDDVNHIQVELQSMDQIPAVPFTAEIMESLRVRNLADQVYTVRCFAARHLRVD